MDRKEKLSKYCGKNEKSFLKVRLQTVRTLPFVWIFPFFFQNKVLINPSINQPINHP